MDAKQLRTFVTIVDLGGFTRAGRRLGLSQSAISQQMRALEDGLSRKILLRNGKVVRPTPAGEVLLDYARQILTKFDEAHRVLNAYEASERGVLRVGCGGAGCESLLPPLLVKFRQAHPQYEVQVRSGDPVDTVERLGQGDLDIGLVTLPTTDANLRTFELGRDEIVAIVGPEHAWAGRRSVEAADFADQPLVAYRRRSDAFQLLQRTLLEAGVFPEIAMEVDRSRGAVELVRAAVGIAVVPRWSVVDDIAAGRLAALSIGRNGLSRRWGLAIRLEEHQPHAVKTFVHLGQEILPPLLTV